MCFGPSFMWFAFGFVGFSCFLIKLFFTNWKNYFINASICSHDSRKWFEEFQRLYRSFRLDIFCSVREPRSGREFTIPSVTSIQAWSNPQVKMWDGLDGNSPSTSTPRLEIFDDFCMRNALETINHHRIDHKQKDQKMYREPCPIRGLLLRLPQNKSCRVQGWKRSLSLSIETLSCDHLC